VLIAKVCLALALINLGHAIWFQNWPAMWGWSAASIALVACIAFLGGFQPRTLEQSGARSSGTKASGL
jgi:hypothetical protein